MSSTKCGVIDSSCSSDRTTSSSSKVIDCLPNFNATDATAPREYTVFGEIKQTKMFYHYRFSWMLNKLKLGYV